VERLKFYYYVKASGLVKVELLDELFRKFESGAPLLAGKVAESTDRKQLQRPARLRYGYGCVALETKSEKTADKPVDSSDASLEDEVTDKDQDLTTADLLFAEELVRRGLLNDWQLQQLLRGRTKFTLGDYWVLDALGRGGYGHVFLGSSGEEYVALKVLPLSHATPELTQRFLREIDVQKYLFHSNLVRFYGSGHDGNVHYMVHEFINGGDLRELFVKEGVLPIEVVAAVLGQVAQGVHFLHQNGIVHRDIKPANVLLADNGVAKLTDFGLAVPFERDFNDPQIQMFDENFLLEKRIDTAAKPTGKVAGTVDYMAPDQISQPSQPSPSWDIYSLGCVLYQLLTGSVPYPDGDTKQKFRDRILFDPKDPRILNQAIPFDLVDLLRRMLTRNPYYRIRSAKEVADRLTAWIPPDGLAGYLKFVK
jgi:hypothetical protein